MARAKIAASLDQETIRQIDRAGGPSRELTAEDWADILNARPEEVSPDSLAVPPGWQPSKT